MFAPGLISLKLALILLSQVSIINAVLVQFYFTTSVTVIIIVLEVINSYERKNALSTWHPVIINQKKNKNKKTTKIVNSDESLFQVSSGDLDHRSDSS